MGKRKRERVPGLLDLPAELLHKILQHVVVTGKVLKPNGQPRRVRRALSSEDIEW